MPVVVAGSGPRAVVTTASYEARRFGVFSATPAERARRLCPDAVFVPPDFELYRARSREVRRCCARRWSAWRSVGLDEAYLDLSGIERYRAAARRVKEAVRGRARASPARSASGRASSWPRWLATPRSPTASSSSRAEEARERFASASPRLVPGIGPKTVERLDALGISDARARSARPPTRSWRSWFGARLGPHLARSRASRTSASSRPRGPPSRSRARPPSTATCTASGSSSRCSSGSPPSSARRSCAQDAPRAHGRHQGALRRLLDRHPGAHPPGRR